MDGLSCGHSPTHAGAGGHIHPHLEAARSDDPSDRGRAATHNLTDLRRARQHARAVIRDIARDIKEYLDGHYISLDSRREERWLNEALTRLASRRLKNDLLRWLSERRRTTMARAARAAFEDMSRSYLESIPEDAFEGAPNLSHHDRSLNRELNLVDAGLLYDDSDSLAEEVGDRVTRQLRLGFARGEDTEQLGRRVDYILSEGSNPDRAKTGVKGQTIMSKGELIAHDSIQDAYVSAAHRRYLENGFRYAVFDATIDHKTSAVCRRLNEHVIDLVETPWLIPGLHPWCRSGIRPILDLDGRTPLSEDDIADSYINTIMRTKSYRPKILDTERSFRPTTLTEQYTPV